MRLDLIKLRFDRLPQTQGGTNMVKRTRTNIAREIDKTPPDHSSARKSAQKEKPLADDIIMSLSNAHENLRARQVFEWESVQPLNVQQAV